MPGPAVHTIISEKLPAEFQDRGMVNVAGALRSNRAAMTYGAMGPDPFFFNLDDLTPSGMSVAQEMVKAWDALGQIQYQLHQFFQPLQNAMLDVKQKAEQGSKYLAANSPLFRKLRKLFIKLRETGKIHSAVMRGYVKKRALDKMDPFGFYVSPYQTCESNHKDWWWFDTLHTRQTGDFATRLLDIARGRAPGKDGHYRRRWRLLAYAIGYVSHLAADVVGHAYVNTMVGGPYRLNQAQRHTTQEKLMDVYAYDRYYNETGFLQGVNDANDDRYYQNPELMNSGLHKNQQFTDGRYDPKDYEIDHSRLFNKPKQMQPIASGLELPDTIARNVSAAANQVYNTSEFGKLTPEEVDQSYRLWYLVLRNSTATIHVVPPSELPDTPPVSEETKKQWEQFENWYENNVDQKPGTSTSPQQCGQQGTIAQQVWDCLKSAADSLWNFVNNAGHASNEFFKRALGLGLYLLQNGPSVPLDAINYFLQQLYENLYASYRVLVLLLTSLGFGYCFRDQLTHPAIAHLTDPQAGDHFGNSVADTIIKPGEPTSGYPREGVQMGPDWNDAVSGVMQGLSQEGHLVVPTTPVEEPRTIPGPDVYAEHGPEVFINDPAGDLAFDGDYIAYPPANQQDTRDPSRGPRPTAGDYRPSATGGTGQFSDPVLGTAVGLTGELFGRYRGNEYGLVPNLNMSGDRGIGYPNWYSEKGCSQTQRYRWWVKHTGGNPQPGATIQWLDTPIEPRYYPDTDSHY